MSSLETLEIAGVPLLLRLPANLDRHAPLILFWHGFGSPNGKADIAKTFPLEQLNAWKAYLGLPLFGQRSAGVEDLMRRQMEDYVLQLLLPVLEQAVRELPNVVDGLRSHCHLDNNNPLGLFGFSAGGLAALLTIVESQLPIQAVVLAGVTKDLAFSQSDPNTIRPEWIEAMAKDAIIFACANPLPEIWPWEAKAAGAAVVATGRSDFPNQVNNCYIKLIQCGIKAHLTNDRSNPNPNTRDR
jgi:predicted esterase